MKKSRKEFNESTTSGAVASVSMPIGKTITRGKGVYPNEKGGNLFTGKKTKKKTPNTVALEFHHVELNPEKFLFYTANYYDEYAIDRYYGSTLRNLKNINDSRYKLLESVEYEEIQPFIDSIKRIDSKKTIEVGDQFSVLMFEIIYFNREINVMGFTVPKTVTEIKRNGDLISYIRFDDGSRYPRLNKVTVDKRPVEYAAYFDDGADKALSFLLLQVPGGWSVDTGDINKNWPMYDLTEDAKKIKQLFIDGNNMKKTKEQTVLENSWKQFKEAKLDEEDIVIRPEEGNRYKPGFIPRDKDRTDHEIEMAKSDLFQSAKNAKKVYEMIKDIPETVGLEGWVQEKIIKAADYLNTVREYLEHKQVDDMTGVVEQDVTEGVYSDKLDAYIAKLEAKPKLTKRERMLLGTAKDYRNERAKKAADNSDHRDAGRKGVAEGSEDREQNRLWQMITDYEQRAKATKSDIKKAHYMKMADDLRLKLKTRDEQCVTEGSDSKKPYGVRYKVFAGKEGRITTKEYWTTSQEKLERAVAKIEAMDNFYEIDGYAGPEYMSEENTNKGKKMTTKKSAKTTYKKAMESYSNESVFEGLDDDIADLAKSLGMNPQIRKPGEKQPTKQPYVAKPPSVDEREKLEKELSSMEDEIKKLSPYKDDTWSTRERWRGLTTRRGSIKQRLAMDSDVSEGVGAKVGGALAIMAALWGGNEITSAKHTPLGKALAVAAQQGDQEAAKHLRNLDTYIDTKQSGLVTKLSNKYLNTQNESSIMKGIQNEAKKMKGEDPCWKGYEMIGKKKKDGKEVPNCVPKKKK